MTGSKTDLIRYRLSRSKDTFIDARILADKERWNSAINRLYYAAYYAVIALLLKYNLKPTTHNGAKTVFSEHFIKKEIYQRNLASYIHNYLHGDKRVTTIICMILTKKMYFPILSLYKN